MSAKDAGFDEQKGTARSVETPSEPTKKKLSVSAMLISELLRTKPIVFIQGSIDVRIVQRVLSRMQVRLSPEPVLSFSLQFHLPICTRLYG